MQKRPYEVMVIFDAAVGDQAIRDVVDRVLDTVRAGGGTPGHVARWGRRTLAYELRKRTEGYYVLIEANAEPAAMAEVGRLLTLADEVLRYKTIRLPDAVALKPRKASPPPPDDPGSGEEAGGGRRRPPRRESQEVA